MLGFRKDKLSQLEKLIGYRFRNRGLLRRAMIHRSYRFENEGMEEDNQRLEFLGDAVLGFLTGAHMFANFEDSDEGVLTSFRSQTTSGDALAVLASDLDLGAYLFMGKGEERSGGRDRSSNLADAMEAVLGAVYIDGGIKGAEKVFRKVFVPAIENLSGDVWAGNPKGKLQEYCQREWKKSPRYQVVGRDGPAHATVFTVEVSLGDGTKAKGQGRNKQKAETEAARAALSRVHGKRGAGSRRRRP